MDRPFPLRGLAILALGVFSGLMRSSAAAETSGLPFPARDPRWQQLQDLNDAWLARAPESATAVALNARILYQHAWAYRGKSYDSGVSAQNRQLYQQLIRRAGVVLDQHPDVARQDPEWDTLRITVAGEHGAVSRRPAAAATTR